METRQVSFDAGIRGSPEVSLPSQRMNGGASPGKSIMSIISSCVRMSSPRPRSLFEVQETKRNETLSSWKSARLCPTSVSISVFVCYRVSNISVSRKVNAKMFWKDLGDLETHSFDPFTPKNLSNVQTLEWWVIPEYLTFLVSSKTTDFTISWSG